PEARLGEPAHRLLRVFRLHDRESAAALEEAAERQPARAAHLDHRELGHVVLVGRALDDRDLARAVEHDGYHLPGLDELAQALGLVASPHAARPVRVFLDRVLELGRLLQAIEEIGGAQVARGAAADQDAVGAQPLEPLDVASAIGLAAREIVVGRRQVDVKDDHAGCPPWRRFDAPRYPGTAWAW